MTQIACTALHYNHQTRLTASRHLSQSIVWLCPNCLVCENKTQLYVYVLFLQIRKSSLLICASLNQTAKLGLLDTWRWDRQLCWNISNCSSMLYNIPEEQRTNLHYGRSLISSMILLVFFFGQEVGTFWRVSTGTRGPLHQFPLRPRSYKTWWDSRVYQSM